MDNMLSWLHTFKAKFVVAYDWSIGTKVNINEKDKKWNIDIMAMKLENLYSLFETMYVWYGISPNVIFLCKKDLIE